MMGHGPQGMVMMGGMGMNMMGGSPGMMGQGGKAMMGGGTGMMGEDGMSGMTGRGQGEMGMMGGPWNNDEDSSDNE